LIIFVKIITILFSIFSICIKLTQIKSEWWKNKKCEKSKYFQKKNFCSKIFSENLNILKKDAFLLNNGSDFLPKQLKKNWKIQTKILLLILGLEPKKIIIKNNL